MQVGRQERGGLPRRRSRVERNLTFLLKLVLLFVVGAMALSLVGDMLDRIRTAAAVVIGAIFFTYLVLPAVRFLGRRMPLGAAVAAIYLGIFVVLGFILSVVVPALLEDGKSLAAAFPSIIHKAQDFVSNPNNQVLSRLAPPLRDYIVGLPSQIGALAQGLGGQVAAGALNLVLSAVGVLAMAVIIPVLSAYMILEGESLRRTALRLVPQRNRVKVAAIARDLDRILGGFVRGQVLLGFIIGACITVMLLLTHVRYAVLIGVMAGVLNVIPYVGSIAGFFPAVTLALFDDGWQHALLVGFLFVAIFQLDGHFITPRIVSESVGLSPLMVIIAILIGGELHGIPGMFIAVPVAAILRVLVLHALPREQGIPAESRRGARKVSA